MRRIDLALIVIAPLLGACASQEPIPTQPPTGYEADTPSPVDEEAPATPGTPIEARKSVAVEYPIGGSSQTAIEVPLQEDLWQHLRSGMSFSRQQSEDHYSRQLDWYSSNQSYIDRTLKRGEKYLYYITTTLEAEQLPLELALLPLVESAYDPFAYSHSHASGLWQFISGTGRRYGLKRDWWYDGRRDVIDSTRAAVAYLKYLRDYFSGDWLLALAAYNSGEGKVMRAVERNRKQGKPTDFWSLRLPRETRSYVPQLLALSAIVRNPAKYGMTLPEIAYRPYFETIELPDQLDLALAARMAATSTEELYQLNPGLRRWLTPTGSRRLNVPVGKSRNFRIRLAETPRSQWIPVREYFVKSGDSLYTIAKRQKVDIAVLKSHNRLSSNLIRVGQVLRIPGRDTDLASLAHGNSTKTHRVRKGETLWDIARRYKMKPEQLARLNDISEKNLIHPGRVLKISSSEQMQPRIRTMNYRVRHGDSLSRIAAEFDLRVKDILQWNQLSPRRYLQPGQTLTLFIDVR